MMKCEYLHEDGCGHYCKLCTIPKDLKEDYPHKYWRVFCYGIKDRLECTNILRDNDRRSKA